MKRKSALLWVMVIALSTVGVSLAIYKNIALGVPFLPGQKIASWTIEATVQFKASGKPIIADLGLPPVSLYHGTQQNVASLGYGFQERSGEEGQRRGVWSASNRDGSQKLYYQITLPEEELRAFRKTSRKVPTVEPTLVGGKIGRAHV